MDRYEYQELKKTGGLVADAALQSEEASRIDIIDDAEEEVKEETTVEPDAEPDSAPSDEQEDAVQSPDDDGEDDLPPLNEKEKTAFEKRLERERKKLEEKLQAEIEERYGKHKKVLESLGGDPDAILARIEENKLIAEANRLADVNGWTQDQYDQYVQGKRNEVEQQRRDKELAELRVQIQINRLRDNPDYAGIHQMEKEIVAKIERTNGALTVEETYWALGGPKRAEQIKLEATMREQAKRAKQPRTVLTDTPSSTTGEKPLAPEIVKDAERMGISTAEARKLMNSEPSGSIDEYRKRKAKAQ